MEINCFVFKNININSIILLPFFLKVIHCFFGHRDQVFNSLKILLVKQEIVSKVTIKSLESQLKHYVTNIY